MRFQREELIEAMGDQSDMMSRRQEGQRQDGVPMEVHSWSYGGQGASKTGLAGAFERCGPQKGW